MGQGAGAPFLNVTSMETSDGSKTNWLISTSNLTSTSTSLQHHQGAVGLELAVEEGNLATGWLGSALVETFCGLVLLIL